MNPEHLQKICKAYGIGGVELVSDIEGGVLNKNYVLKTSSGTSFLKHIRDKAKSRLPYIARVEMFMHERGIPSVCMLKTSEGKQWVEFDSEIYSVYPFIQSDSTKPLSLDDFERTGTMLGKIHRAGSAGVPSELQINALKVKSNEDRYQQIKEYGARILAKKVIDEIDQTFLDYIALKLKIIPTLSTIQSLPNGTLTHGDYHARNLLFASQTRDIIGVCDWEKAEMAPRSYEVARAITYACFDGEYDESTALTQAKVFLSSYNAEYPLPTDELRSGFAQRLQGIAASVWLEDQYYVLQDTRANHFITHESRLLKDFIQGDMLERIFRLA